MSRRVDHGEPIRTSEPPACYRHPGRPALSRCARCERPICADDMIEAPVGYQCPECARGGQPVRRMADVSASASTTRALVIAIGAVFVMTLARRDLVTAFGLVPALVGTGEVWRLVTSAFVHANLMHVGFNGLLLWQLGGLLEPGLGRSRYLALYAAGIAGGSLGVVLLSWVTVATPLGGVPIVARLFATSPLSVTVGASGAVFALMGAALSGLRRQGVNPWRTSIGSLVLLNLLLTFAIPSISVGGHLGGLLAGMAAGRLLVASRERATARAWLVGGLALAMFVVSALLAEALLG